MKKTLLSGVCAAAFSLVAGVALASDTTVDVSQGMAQGAVQGQGQYQEGGFHSEGAQGQFQGLGQVGAQHTSVTVGTPDVTVNNNVNVPTQPVEQTTVNGIKGDDNYVKSIDNDGDDNAIANMGSQAARSVFGDAIAGHGNIVDSYNVDQRNDTRLETINLGGDMTNIAGASIGGEAKGGLIAAGVNATNATVGLGGDSLTAAGSLGGDGGSSLSAAGNLGSNRSTDLQGNSAGSAGALGVAAAVPVGSASSSQTGGAASVPVGLTGSEQGGLAGSIPVGGALSGAASGSLAAGGLGNNNDPSSTSDAGSGALVHNDSMAQVNQDSYTKTMQDSMAQVNQDSAAKNNQDATASADTSAQAGSANNNTSSSAATQTQDATSASAAGAGGAAKTTNTGARGGDVAGESNLAINQETKGGDNYGGDGGAVEALLQTGGIGAIAIANVNGIISMTQSTGFMTNQMTSISMNANATMK